MKKLILMLCACTIAFAGLLTSCKNEVEEYVDVTMKTYDYIYSVTGTLKIVHEQGTTGAITKQTETYTITQGKGSASWTERTTEKTDCINIGIDVIARADKTTQQDNNPAETTYNTDFSMKYFPFGDVNKIDGKYYIKNNTDAEYVEVKISDIKKKGFTYSGTITYDSSTETTVDKYTYTIDFTFDNPAK